MTAEGVITMLATIKGVFPHFYAKADKMTLECTSIIWHEMLSDVDDITAMNALKLLLATNEYPPTIASILEAVRKIKHPALPDAGEAWRRLSNAITQYGYYRESEGLASLDETTRKVAEYIGWRQICTAPLEHEMANRAHFIKMWETISNRIKEEQLLPLELREMISSIGKTVPNINVQYS